MLFSAGPAEPGSTVPPGYSCGSHVAEVPCSIWFKFKTCHSSLLCRWGWFPAIFTDSIGKHTFQSTVTVLTVALGLSGSLPACSQVHLLAALLPSCLFYLWTPSVADKTVPIVIIKDMNNIMFCACLLPGSRILASIQRSRTSSTEGPARDKLI